jgi:hypothetical protein
MHFWSTSMLVAYEILTDSGYPKASPGTNATLCTSSKSKQKSSALSIALPAGVTMPKK